MKQTQRSNAGFSLVELMIAMVVLAIGIMATMAMQFSALAGYTAAREATGATEVARSVEQSLRLESLGWTPGQPVPAGTQMNDALGQWTAVNATPWSVRMTETGPRRYCAFVRGALLNDPEVEFMRVSIVVVYPAANGSLPGTEAGHPWGQCDQVLPLVGGDFNPQQIEALELEGLRATFLSTSLRPLG